MVSVVRHSRAEDLEVVAPRALGHVRVAQIATLYRRNRAAVECRYTRRRPAGRSARLFRLLRVVGVDCQIFERPIANGNTRAADVVVIDAFDQTYGTDARLVDKPRVVELPADSPDSQHSVDDRQIDGAVEIVVFLRGMRGIRILGGAITFDGVEIGQLRHEADRAAHGAGAIQRALRAAQHLHAIQVVQADVGFESTAVIGVGTAEHGLAIVDAGCGSAGRVDSANDILLIARAEVLDRKSGNAAGDVHDAGGAVLL